MRGADRCRCRPSAPLGVHGHGRVPGRASPAVHPQRAIDSGRASKGVDAGDEGAGVVEAAADRQAHGAAEIVQRSAGRGDRAGQTAICQRTASERHIVDRLPQEAEKSVPPVLTVVALAALNVFVAAPLSVPPFTVVLPV